MNPYEVFSNKNQILLKEAVVSFENREYNYDECKVMFHKVIEHIMSHSKNEIQEISYKYNDITGVLESYLSKKEKV